MRDCDKRIEIQNGWVLKQKTIWNNMDQIAPILVVSQSFRNFVVIQNKIHSYWKWRSFHQNWDFLNEEKSCLVKISLVVIQKSTKHKIQIKNETIHHFIVINSPHLKTFMNTHTQKKVTKVSLMCYSLLLLLFCFFSIFHLRWLTIYVYIYVCSVIKNNIILLLMDTLCSFCVSLMRISDNFFYM